MVNLITDVPPALAIALQPPGDQGLSDLAREGEEALERSLRTDVFRRALVTGLPSGLVAVVASRVRPAEASTVAFVALVGSQLAQTLELGVAGGGLTPALAAGLAASWAVLVGSLAAAPLRRILDLVPLSGVGLSLAASAVAGTVLISRLTTGLVRERQIPEVGWATGSRRRNGSGARPARLHLRRGCGGAGP
ncbi:MAG: cation-translocating P-type ATPase C-terminal domain-containing protein [Armatimonadetes bacterium]|nr:cation-translocating P-type ATPase C-terminal domain-containing protein [Armatimonadota bacterium]